MRRCSFSRKVAGIASTTSGSHVLETEVFQTAVTALATIGPTLGPTDRSPS